MATRLALSGAPTPSVRNSNQFLALEKHYRVEELAELWALSCESIRRLFSEEPGVIRLTRPGVNKRKYVTLSIPCSVAVRVHERLGHKPLQAKLPTANPPRIILLRDLHRRVPKKLRQVIQADAA